MKKFGLVNLLIFLIIIIFSNILPISATTNYYPNSTGGHTGFRDSTTSDASLWAWGAPITTAYTSGDLNNVSTLGGGYTIGVNVNPSLATDIGLRTGHRFVINITETASSISSIAIQVNQSICKSISPAAAVIRGIMIYIGNVSSGVWVPINRTNGDIGLPGCPGQYNETFFQTSIADSFANYVNQTPYGNFVYLLVFANASSGNVGAEGNGYTQYVDFINLTIVTSGSDTTSPNVNIIFPTATTYNSLPLNFNVSLDENGSVQFTLDGGINNRTMTVNLTGTGFNYTNNSLADGTYTFRAYANDTAGNTNYSRSIAFGVDTTPPIPTIIFPVNKTYNSASFNFNVSLNENGSVQFSLNAGITNYTMTANLTGNGFNFTNSSIGDGSYTFQAYANDTVGNNNYSAIRGFSIDTVAPLVTIIFPTNLSYNSTFIPLNFNVSLNENGSVQFTLDGGINNLTMTSNTTSTGFNYTNTTIGNGNYIFRAYANDSAGNINNSRSITFNVNTTVADNLAPNVNIIFPTNITYNKTYTQLNFSVSLSENGSVQFTLDGGKNNKTMTANLTGNGFNFTNRSISDGTYTFRVYANDTSGNTNYSRSIVFNMDKTSPNFTSFQVNLTTGISGTNTNFSVFVNDRSQVNRAWFAHNFDLIRRELINSTNSISSVTYSNLGGLTQTGQSLRLNATGYLKEVCFNISYGVSTTRNDITVKLFTTSGGKPSGTNLTTAITISSSSISSSAQEICANFTKPRQLTGNVYYALTLSASDSSPLAYSVRRATVNNHDGAKLTSTNGGTSWTNTFAGDLYFKATRGSYDWKNETNFAVDANTGTISFVKKPLWASTTNFNYYWCANDTVSNQNCSSLKTYFVQEPAILSSGTDTIFPTGYILSPPNGTRLNGNVTLDGTASDDIGIAHVSFQYKNSTVTSFTNITGCEEVSTPYDCIWNTHIFANESEGYDINMIACDVNGNCNTTIQTKHYTIDRKVPIAEYFVFYPTSQSSIRNIQNLTFKLNTTDGSGAGLNSSKFDLTQLNTTGNVSMFLENGSLITGNYSLWNITLALSGSSTGLQQGSYYIYDNASPTNNLLFSTASIQIDNNAPNWSELNFSQQPPIYNGTEITFQIHSFDTINLSHFTFANNFTGDWQNETQNFTETFEDFASNITMLYSGNQSFYFILYDDAGNYNQTPLQNIQILGSLPGELIVSLISPADLSSSTSTSQTFTYNYTNGTASSCGLYINYTLSQSTADPVVDASLTFSQTFGVGDYVWFVRCNNTDSFFFDSEERTLSITSSSSGGGDTGGGSGGGTLCTSNYVCGTWGECQNSLQARTCVDTKCSTTAKIETRSCSLIECNPNLICTDWSLCLNNITQKQCTDRNNCAPDSTYSEEKVCLINECLPKVECTDSDECSYAQKLEDIFKGKLRFSGQKEQLCTDSNSCIEDYTQEAYCESNVLLTLMETEQCGKKVLSAYDSETKEEVLNINLESLKANKLDIVFTDNSSISCSTCFNGVLDGYEEGVDCGGDCRLCVYTSPLYQKKSLLWILWLLIAILLLIIAYLIYKKDKIEKVHNLIKKGEKELHKRHFIKARLIYQKIRKIYYTLKEHDKHLVHAKILEFHHQLEKPSSYYHEHHDLHAKHAQHHEHDHSHHPVHHEHEHQHEHHHPHHSSHNPDHNSHHPNHPDHHSSEHGHHK